MDPSHSIFPLVAAHNYGHVVRHRDDQSEVWWAAHHCRPHCFPTSNTNSSFQPDLCWTLFGATIVSDHQSVWSSWWAFNMASFWIMRSAECGPAVVVVVVCHIEMVWLKNWGNHSGALLMIYFFPTCTRKLIFCTPFWERKEILCVNNPKNFSADFGVL